MTHHIQSVINGLYKACQDDEPFVVNQVSSILYISLYIHSFFTLQCISLSDVLRLLDSTFHQKSGVS